MAKEPITVYPPGLLPQLGIKGAGAGAPKAIVDELVPVMSMEHLYAANDVQTDASVLSNASAGGSFTTGLLVPAGEAWRLYAVGCIVDNFSAAPTGVAVSIIVSPPAAAFSCPVAYRDGMTGAAGATYRFGVTFGQPLVLLSGSAIQAVLETTLSAGTVRISARAIFQRLRY